MRGRKKVHHRRESSLYDEEKRWKTTPLGVRILLIYVSVLALFYLVFGLTFPTNLFFGFLFTGTSARIMNFTFLIVLGFIIYGFIFKKHWVGKLAMFWFSLEVISLLTSIIMGKTILEDGAAVYFITIFVFGINLFILWYLFAKKDYFIDLRHHHTSAVDKVFVLGIFLMIFFAIIATTTYGVNVYKDTIKITDKVIDELSGVDPDDAKLICSYKKDKEKDICYVVMATVYDDMPKEICDNVKYKFYKLTCIQAVVL